MAALDYTELRLAFRNKARAIAEFPADQYCVWEGRGNTLPPSPTQDVVWCEEYLLPLTEQVITHAASQQTGTYVLAFMYEKGRGTRQLEAVMKAVADDFQPIQYLTDPDLTNAVVIERVTRSRVSTVEDSPWVRATVTVRWRTATPR